MNLQEILGLVNKPGRYIGGEKNAWNKPWSQADIRTCCIFPDLYEIGMSHQGLLILYDIINRQEHLLADRCYCPDLDMENLLRKHSKALFGLETRRPLKDFDILAITLPYELCYTNIFTILDLASIPFFNHQRLEGSWPLILGGGSCCLNPEPVAELFDAIVIGDGEEAIIEINQAIKEQKTHRWTKRQLLEKLATIKGIYVPQLYRPLYGPDEAFLGIEAMEPAPKRIKRRIVTDLSPEIEIQAPLVPNIRIVHDRLGVEIARGCTRGCRYCQATTIYRPVREKSVEQIVDTALRGIKATGWEEVSLLSLSTGDYTAIEELIPRVMDEFVPQHCSVSLPSLRVGTLTDNIMDQIKRVRKTGITLAPEAGSERLRKAINKGITEEDLLNTVKEAFARGWKNVKLYFMIGLPGETDQDLIELVELVKKVRAQADKIKNFKGSVQVTASIGTFVPKPQTPFQWEGQISVEESRRRLAIIKKGLRRKAFKVKWHDPRQSFLEGVFSRGDRPLSRLLHKAWTMGARLDAWTDNLRPEIYEEAAAKLEIDLSSYLQPMDEKAPLYWDHIDSGVKKPFLRLEKKRAQQGKYTPDCRFNECQGCGVCDFKSIKNLLKGKTYKNENENEKSNKKLGKRPNGLKEQGFFFVVEYAKLFNARFIGHLDMVRLFHRAVRRAGIPVAYSKGFHPMPKIAFENPISLGMESISERFTIELREPMTDRELEERLAAQMTHDIKILSVKVTPKKQQLVPKAKQSFVIIVPDMEIERVEKNLTRFRAADRFEIQVKRKKGEMVLNLKNRVAFIGLYSDASEPQGGTGLETKARVAVEAKTLNHNYNCNYYSRVKSWISRALEETSSRKRAVLKLTLDQSVSPAVKPSEVIAKILEIEEKRIKTSRFLKL